MPPSGRGTIIALLVALIAATYGQVLATLPDTERRLAGIVAILILSVSLVLVFVFPVVRSLYVRVWATLLRAPFALRRVGFPLLGLAQVLVGISLAYPLPAGLETPIAVLSLAVTLIAVGLIVADVNAVGPAIRTIMTSTDARERKWADRRAWVKRERSLPWRSRWDFIAYALFVAIMLAVTLPYALGDLR